jgi:hypothetical protein
VPRKEYSSQCQRTVLKLTTHVANCLRSQPFTVKDYGYFPRRLCCSAIYWGKEEETICKSQRQLLYSTAKHDSTHIGMPYGRSSSPASVSIALSPLGAHPPCTPHSRSKGRGIKQACSCLLILLAAPIERKWNPGAYWKKPAALNRRLVGM